MNIRDLLLFFLCVCGSFYVKADTYCVGHYIGNNVGFTSSLVGDQFNKLNVNTYGQWNSGLQVSQYKSTMRVDELMSKTAYSVAVPKKMKLTNGGNELDVTLLGSDVITVPTNSDWQAVLVQTSEESCYDTGGVWEQRIAGIVGGKVDIRISGNGLPSGVYKVDIPYILAWGTSVNGSADSNFRDTWKAGNVGVNNVTGYFSISFSVKNKCDVLPVNTVLDLNHGIMTPYQVSGNKVISESFSLSCNIPTSVKFTFQPQNVELGNGVSSKLTLKVSGKEYSDVSVPVSIYRDTLQITSTLQQKQDTPAGELHGSSILTVNYD